ncbi:MAG: serine/threonine protein kinase [Myxococcales bacterium]|nr:serine/threonine protein kinase [Myxococcales bacterium]
MTPTVEISALAGMPATHWGSGAEPITEVLPAREPRPRLRPGTRLGRYVVGSLLGRGGMGAVYLGHDPVLERGVALKVALDEGSDVEPRMAREARMLAQVSDPHVVQVFDVGRFDGGTFVAMEPVRGCTLGAWRRARTRRPREVLSVFAQAGRGLAAIHRAGLVHRDFKPDNVVLGHDGRARVLDFGLAVDAGTWASGSSTGDGLLDQTRLTSTGVALGTPAYMAPEQHHGGDVDPRADQFSFCLALFEALVGRRPYQGATVDELLHEKLSESAGRQRRRLPRRCRAAVLRGLRADRSERWPTMDCLLQELAAA